jgi:TetR/AcrR family transcriptional regulator, tetracycline repressor protein
MARKLGRPRVGEERLSRKQILVTALRLIDGEGIEAMSMRRLAAELGVDPMALYHHLPNKEAVLAGVTELVFSELRLPAQAEGPWQQQVSAFARAYRDLVLAHPNLVLHLITSMGAGSPALLAANEVLYAALASAGLPPRQIVQAADLVVDYLNGWALAAGLARSKHPDEAQGLAALLQQYPTEHYPTLSRIFSNLGEDEHPGGMEEGLVLLLAGIEAVAQDVAGSSARQQGGIANAETTAHGCGRKDGQFG